LRLPPSNSFLQRERRIIAFDAKAAKGSRSRDSRAAVKRSQRSSLRCLPKQPRLPPPTSVSTPGCDDSMIQCLSKLNAPDYPRLEGPTLANFCGVGNVAALRNPTFVRPQYQPTCRILEHHTSTGTSRLYINSSLTQLQTSHY
jgi:hypothetical protein